MPRAILSSAPRSVSFIGLVLIILVVLLAGALDAQIPKKINYQGLLLDKDTGEPLEGMHSLVFRIYDSRTGGVPLWTESRVETPDSSGVVSAVLGGLTPINIAFADSMWLEVQIDGEVLSPRKDLVSVPFAFHASNSDSLGGNSPGYYIGRDEVGVIGSEMLIDGPGSNIDADLLDGQHAAAFSASGHAHDDRYYTESELNTAGTINQAGNPVAWSKLKGVPAGFADAVDDTGRADGHSLDASDGSPVNALYVDAAGKVGIGTTTPQSLLTVKGATAGLTVEATSGDPAVYWKNAGDAAGEIWGIYKDDVTEELRFYNDAQRIAITAAGNVGIGVSSPTQAKLQVFTGPGTGIRAYSNDQASIVGLHADPTGTWSGAAIIGVSAESTGMYAKGVVGIKANSTGTSSAGGYAGSFVSDNYRGIYAFSMDGYYDAYFAGIGGIYSAGGIWTAMAAKTVVVNGGAEPLEPGDIVAMAGVSESPLGPEPVLAVRKANAGNASAVVGVVVATLRAKAAEFRGTELWDVEATDGAAPPGGYLAIATSGLVPQVKVGAASGSAQIGDWLAVSATAGVGEMLDPELTGSAPVVGKIAGPVDAATGKAPVFVILR